MEIKILFPKSVGINIFKNKSNFKIRCSPKQGSCFFLCSFMFKLLRNLSGKGNESGREGREMSVRAAKESIALHSRKLSEFMSHIVARFRRGFVIICYS